MKEHSMNKFLEALAVVSVAAFAGYLLGAHWPHAGLAAGLLLSGALLMAYIQANIE